VANDGDVYLTPEIAGSKTSSSSMFVSESIIILAESDKPLDSNTWMKIFNGLVLVQAASH
jgi:hypothetical protein